MTPLFESRLEEVLFWVAFLGSVGVPLLLFGRWSLKNAATKKSAPRRDMLMYTNFVLLPAALVAITLGYARIGVLPHWLFYPGLALFIPGLALTTWSYRTLGRFFSLEVQCHYRSHRQTWFSRRITCCQPRSAGASPAAG